MSSDRICESLPGRRTQAPQGGRQVKALLDTDALLSAVINPQSISKHAAALIAHEGKHHRRLRCLSVGDCYLLTPGTWRRNFEVIADAGYTLLPIEVSEPMRAPGVSRVIMATYTIA